MALCCGHQSDDLYRRVVQARIPGRADLLEIQDENPFRVRAYRNAARVVRDYPRPLVDEVRKGTDVRLGRVVAVKVRRPDVVEICAFDLAVMHKVAWLLTRIPSLAALSPQSSALMIAQIFLAPFLTHLQGGKMEKGPLGHRIKAALATSIHSTIGLEEYIRVRIEETAEGSFAATPIFGKSGMLSTMVKAAGVIVIPMNAEGFSKGATVQVIGL